MDLGKHICSPLYHAHHVFYAPRIACMKPSRLGFEDETSYSSTELNC